MRIWASPRVALRALGVATVQAIGTLPNKLESALPRRGAGPSPSLTRTGILNDIECILLSRV